MAPRKVRNFSIWVQQTPTRIHEKSIYSLLNKTTDLPFVSPGIFWPIEPHVHHITLVKALLKKKGSGYANRPTPEFILINEGLIEIPSYNPRQTVELSVGAFSGKIGLPPAVTGWAASCGDGP